MTFGIHTRSSVPGSILAVMHHASGSIVSSTGYSGSGGWEFVGMTSLYNRANPSLYFSVFGDTELTGPTLTYGGSAAMPGASLMLLCGARMSRMLLFGMSGWGGGGGGGGGGGVPPPPPPGDAEVLEAPEEHGERLCGGGRARGSGPHHRPAE